MTGRSSPAGAGRRKPPPARTRSWGWWGLLALAVVASFLIGAVAGVSVKQVMSEEEAAPVAAPAVAPRFERTNILVLGSDVGYRGRVLDDTAPTRSDTLMVASLDPAASRIHVLSLPRDTKVVLPGRGEDKINAALAIGGPELARQVVSEFLGVPVHHYVRLKLDGLLAIVDAVGGVELEIPRALRYRDRAAGLVINLPKGRVLLDGKKAQQYLRFRHDEQGDIGRVQRQQLFLKALELKFSQPATLVRLPQILEIVARNVETDMFPTDLVRLAAWAKGLPPGSVELDMIPGAFSDMRHGPSYWLADATATQEIARRMLSDEPPPEAPASGSVVPLAQRQAARLTVLNATMHPGLGNDAARILRQEGWTVWVVGNAERRNLTTTMIAPRHVVRPLMQPIMRTLGVVGSEGDSTEADPTTDYTIRVGEDFVEAMRRTRRNAVTLPAGR